MILKEKEISELHEIEIEIFKNFLEICEKLNLRYFLLGGSTLGTARHQGFIPWDDDIDVGMPRKDYEVFLNEGQKLLSDDLFIQTIDTDKNYRCHFSKIRKTNSTFIEESVKNVEMNQGIYIDIFPLDGAGNTLEEATKIFHQYSVLNEIYIHKNKKHSKEGIKNKFRYLYYDILSFKYKNVIDIEHQIQKFCSSFDYDQCQYVCNYFGMWREKEIADKIWFGEGTVKQFESLMVMIPYNYDAYLTKLYKDYMQLPPTEKRVAPHCYILDTKESYKKYLGK